MTPSRFVKHLKENGIETRGPNEDSQGFTVTFIDLTSTGIRIRHSLPVLVPNRGLDALPREEIDAAINTAAAYARSKNSRLAVLVGGMVADEAQHRAAKRSNVAIFEPRDMAAIADAKRGPAKEQAVVHALVRRLGRQTLSPYVMGQPAYGASFFGRSTIVDKFVRRGASSLTIMGNRRIGKTSLLRELKHRLILTSGEVCTADIYASNCHSTYDVIHELLAKVSIRVGHDLAPHEIYRFPAIVRQIAGNGKIYFFIDELDSLIEFDRKQNFECLHLLRAAAEEGFCRVFFAGFRRVMAAREQNDTPLFNFTTAVVLAGLSLADTTDMVHRPLLNLGIDMHGTGVAAAIYRETGGYPELIQMFCDQAIDLYEATGTIPSVAELLEQVFSSDLFQSKVVGTFLGSTSALEQLTAYLLIREAGDSNIDTYEFDFRDVARVLHSASLELEFPETWKLVRHLVVGGVIAQVGGTHRHKFSVPQLARYCKNIDLDGCITGSLRVVRNSDLVTQLESEPHPALPADAAQDVL